jgi:hypothetical protein
MQEQLIEFETAKLAKEKGFGVSGENIYENGELLCEVEFKNWNNGTQCLLAPTQSLLQKWLREKHKILVEATHFTAEYFTYNLYKRDNTIYILKLGGLDNICNTYEEALERGLQESLKLIENEK